jgi:hypothetical protein
MSYTVGETISDELELADGATGQTAATITATAYLLPSAATTAAVAITEIGGGVYALSFVPSAAGQWSLRAVYDGDTYGPSTFDVDAQGSVGITPTPVTGGTSLSQLVRRLGYRLGDVIVCTATADGTANQFYDEVNLRRANSSYRSWQAYVVSAGVPGNVGALRFVQGSDQASGSITVQPALPAGIFMQGDVVDLHGSAGTGWTVTEKIAALNDAILQAATMGGIEIVADAADLFDRDDPLVTVPAQFRFVHNVEWLDSEGLGRTIPYAKARGKPGWYANKATGQIELVGGYREEADGAYLRFWGHGDHVALTDADDATLVNPTWLVAAAGYYLVTGYGQDRNPDKARSLVADLRREMEVWRRAATRVRPSTSIAVRGF